MAGVISHNTLYPQVLEAIDAFVNSQPKGKFSDFKLPKAFVEQCRLYLKRSPAPCGNTASRFDLPFECFVQYNYYKEPRGEEFNDQLIKVYADPEEIGGWQNAIRCLQRYCFNLLLAPKRKDFHYIKLSNAYYQYNIAKSFKGAEKIMDAMGYKVVKDGGKPHYQVLTMQLSSNPDRKKIAKLVVDLVLFDLELETIHQCITLHNKHYPNNHCSIKDALEARTKTKGGVQEAMGYLWHMLKGKSGEAVGKFSNKSVLSQPQNPHDQHATPSSGTISESGDFQTPNASPATSRNVNATQSGSRKESSFPHIDPAKDLPPPDIDDPSVNFTSVHHTNPSSEFDDEGLVPESTHLGYRNPPETKHNTLAGHGLIGNPQMSAGGYVPTYPPQATAASSSTKYPQPTVISHDRGHQSGVSQFDRSQPPYETRDDFPRDAYYLRSTSHGSGELHSLPPPTSSVRSMAGNTTTRNFPSIDNQLAPTGGTYARQKSMPTSPCGGESSITFTTSPDIPPTNTMAVMVTTGANSSTIPATYGNVPGNPVVSTTISKQSSTTDTSTSVVYGDVPLRGPVSTAATAVSDSTTTSTAPKHGKLDLVNLRKKTKEATAKINIPVTDHPPPQREKPDMTTLKDHLDKKRDTRATVEGINVKPAHVSSDNYVNIDNFLQERSEVTKPTSTVGRNPVSKRPAPTPRSSKESMSIPEETRSSKEPTSNPEETVEYWQCAVCVMVNEAKRDQCKKCQSNCGYLSVSQAFCSFCNLLVYISEQKSHATSTCPMCKETLIVSSLI